MSELHANTPNPGVFWRKRLTKRRNYSKLYRKSLTLLKWTRSKSKQDRVIQLNCEGVRCYASCQTTSNIGELQPPKVLKMVVLLSEKLWLLISVAILVCYKPSKWVEVRVFIYIYIIYIYIYIYESGENDLTVSFYLFDVFIQLALKTVVYYSESNIPYHEH